MQTLKHLDLQLQYQYIWCLAVLLHQFMTSLVLFYFIFLKHFVCLKIFFFCCFKELFLVCQHDQPKNEYTEIELFVWKALKDLIVLIPILITGMPTIHEYMCWGCKFNVRKSLVYFDSFLCSEVYESHT